MFREKQVIKEILQEIYDENAIFKCLTKVTAERIANILHGANYMPFHASTLRPENSIRIVWHADDVMERAKKQGKEITHEQALNILSEMERRHDCNEGINWIVIDCHTEFELSKESKDA